MTRAEKAVKLVAAKRVHVGWVSKETNGEERPVAAAGTVDGFHDTYLVSYSPFGAVCTCPGGVSHRKCSHSLALELAVAAEKEIQLELMLK